MPLAQSSWSKYEDVRREHFQQCLADLLKGSYSEIAAMRHGKYNTAFEHLRSTVSVTAGRLLLVGALLTPACPFHEHPNQRTSL